MSKLAPNILKTASIGKHSEDGGLQLRVTGIKEDGTRTGSWFFRYSFQGKQQEVGLGSIKRVTLKQAREERDRYANLMSDRRNPINPKDAKREERSTRTAEATPTFAEVTMMAFEAKKGELRGDGKSGRWLSPLEQHVLPKIGGTPIDQISRRSIKDALDPIWKNKAPTAKKAIQRIGVVLRYARAMGLPVDVLAVDDAKLLLGAQGHQTKHHPDLPPAEAARLFQALDVFNATQRALAFYMLQGGGTRIRPVLEMTFDQVKDDTWTILGESMKGKRGKVEDFRVPVTPAMANLIEISRAQNEDGSLVFRSPYRRRPQETAVTDQAVENVMRKFEQDWEWEEAYRPHGLRATFRTWAGKENPAIYAVAETALAHKVGNKVERSYERNDFFQERRELLEKWGAFLADPANAQTPR